MDARQIQDLRAMLAAQAEPAPPHRKRPLAGLARLLRPRRQSPAPLALSSIAAPAAQAAPSPPDMEEAPLLLIVPEAAAPDTVPPELLISGLAPRRPAFGQRREPVLDLSHPAATEPRRLMLLAPGGAPVGEIVLHGTPEPIHALQRRPFEAPHAETPFFPEDLLDEPHRGLRAGPSGAVRRPGRSAIAPPPSGGMAASFLLAALAARLAAEEAALSAKLSEVRA